jgi:hypothetical protein
MGGAFHRRWESRSHPWDAKYVVVFWLVVFTILKNMKVIGKDNIPYMMEK